MDEREHRDRIADARNDRREFAGAAEAVPQHVRDAINEGMAAMTGAIKTPERPPRLDLHDEDGEQVRRFTPDGKFEAWLIFDGPIDDGHGGIIRKPLIVTLAFPNADVARDHLKPVGHAVELLNLVLERAFAARNDPTPDAATCQHHVIFERFRRVLPMQATCDRCLTVLVPDVAAWLNKNDYGHLTDGPHVPGTHRETVASIIEEQANRGR